MDNLRERFIYTPAYNYFIMVTVNLLKYIVKNCKGLSYSTFSQTEAYNLRDQAFPPVVEEIPAETREISKIHDSNFSDEE